MKLYHLPGRAYLCILLVIDHARSSSAAARFSGGASSSGSMSAMGGYSSLANLANLCPPGMVPNTRGDGMNGVGNMSINGLGGLAGGGFGRIGGTAPIVCVKGADAFTLISNASKLAKDLPAVKKINSQNAISSLAKLQGRCEAEVNIKTQICYQNKAIVDKTKNPKNAVSSNLNTVNFTEEGKHRAMVVIEKFGKEVEKEVKPPTVDQYISRPNFKVTFNDFGQKIREEGQIPKTSKESVCIDCLRTLQDAAAAGGDIECECDDTLSLGLGAPTSTRWVGEDSSKYSEKYASET